jgi:hypothetical protein
MKRINAICLLCLFSFAFGCSAIVDDYDAISCPDTVDTCDDIAPDDPELQEVGCCTENNVIYFCKSGVVEKMECETCDYDPDMDKMACINAK